MSTVTEPERVTFASDGLTLTADASGPADGAVVLLLHGGGQTRHAWDGTREALAGSGYRAIAIDARGHGESDWAGEGRYALEDFANDLQNIVGTLDTPPTIVGASLGGSTAMLCVGTFGMHAKAVVLVDIAPQIEPAGVERIFQFMTKHPKGFADVDEAADAVADYLPHRERPRDTTGLRKNLRRREDGRLYWHWDPAFLEAFHRRRGPRRFSLEASARNLSLPTLLIRGKLSDLLSEEGARAFLELVPHAQYVDVTGAAHMVAGDRNDRFTAAVVGFLDEISS